MFRVYVCFSNSFRYDEVVVARVVLDKLHLFATSTCSLQNYHGKLEFKALSALSLRLALLDRLRQQLSIWGGHAASWSFVCIVDAQNESKASLSARHRSRTLVPGGRARGCVCVRERECVWPQLSDRSL